MPVFFGCMYECRYFCAIQGKTLSACDDTGHLYGTIRQCFQALQLVNVESGGLKSSDFFLFNQKQEMKDKILSALKKGIGKTSINEKTLNAYVEIIADKIDDENQIEEAVRPYVDVLKEFQGNINSVAAQALKDKESELAKTAEERAAQEAAQKAAEDASKGGGNEQEPSWFKQYREQQDKRLTAIETEKTSSTRKKRLEEITKDIGSLGIKVLKDFGRMTFDTDDAFEEYLEETRSDIETAKQEESNQGLAGSTRPGGGKGAPAKEASQKQCDEIAAKMNI